MNLSSQSAHLVLDAPARAETALLLALLDLGGASLAEDVLNHVMNRQFLRTKDDSLAAIANDYLPQTKSVLKREDYLILTRQGKQRLRNLCELAVAMRQQLKKFSSAAYVVINRYRDLSNFAPFVDQAVTTLPIALNADGTWRDHHVYVILLDSKVRNGFRGQMINPDARQDMPCLYVGMTSFTPEERFKHHKMGRLPSREVQHYGLCLVPNLFAHFNPLPADQAEETEKALSIHLREQGFAVLAGHHDTEILDAYKG